MFSPRVYDLLSFLLLLRDRLKSPGAIFNYFSSVKIWVTAGPGDSSAFSAYEISVIKRGLSKNSKHVPTRATPLCPLDFKRIIQCLFTLDPKPVVLIVSLLFGYFTLIRQSNLVTTGSVTSSPHVLKFKDVEVTEEAVFITIISTKSHPATFAPVIFRLPALENSVCCPVTAWKLYIATVNPSPSSPAFLLPNGEPLSRHVLTRALKLISCSLFGPTKCFTLHSLRRGATQACQGAGLTLSNLMSAGMWRSAAVKNYLQPIHISAAPSALGKLLG